MINCVYHGDRGGRSAAGTGLAELIVLYYRLVPAEELSTAEPAELAAAVQSHLALAADRVPGRALVRLLNPTLAEHGWSSRDTVVQIVTDDMPYLVDSVVAELARRKPSVRRLVHPIVVVRRDLTGTLQEVLPAPTQPRHLPVRWSSPGCMSTSIASPIPTGPGRCTSGG
jgi:glutamate dehydrogenase